MYLIYYLLKSHYVEDIDQFNSKYHIKFTPIYNTKQNMQSQYLGIHIYSLFKNSEENPY